MKKAGIFYLIFSQKMGIMATAAPKGKSFRRYLDQPVSEMTHYTVRVGGYGVQNTTHFNSEYTKQFYKYFTQPSINKYCR